MGQREHMELEELREQVSLLKDKLQRQQIISERMIAEAAQKRVGKLNRAGVIWGIFGLFAMVWCSAVFHQVGFSDEFVVGTALLLAVCAIVTIYAHWNLHSVDVAHGNLIEITQKLLRFRKIYANWHFYSIPALLIWCYFLYYDAKQVLEYPETFLWGGLVGGIIGAIIGLKKHYAILREADELLANLRELMQE